MKIEKGLIPSNAYFTIFILPSFAIHAYSGRWIYKYMITVLWLRWHVSIKWHMNNDDSL